MDLVAAIKDTVNIMGKKPLPVLLVLIFEIALVLPVSLLVAHAIPTGGTLGSSQIMSPLATLDLLYHGLAIIVVISIVGILITPLLIGYFVNIANQYYNKKPLSTPLAFTAAKKRYVSVLGASVLLTIVGGVMIIVPVVLIFLSFSTTLLLLPVGFLILLFVLFLFEIWTFETYQVIFAENKNAVPAFKRSMQIGSQNWGSIVALLILVGIGYFILSFVFGIFAGIFGGGNFLILAAIFRGIPAGLFVCFAIILPVAFYRQLKKP